MQCFASDFKKWITALPSSKYFQPISKIYLGRENNNKSPIFNYTFRKEKSLSQSSLHHHLLAINVMPNLPSPAPSFPSLLVYKLNVVCFPFLEDRGPVLFSGTGDTQTILEGVREMEPTHHKLYGILCLLGAAWASLNSGSSTQGQIARLRSGVSAPMPRQGWSKTVIFWGMHYSWTCKLQFHMNWIGSPTWQDRAGDRSGKSGSPGSIKKI